MLFSSRNRPAVVVVTGASAGVGRAVAQEFARGGSAVGLIARGREGLEGAAREVEQLGGRALVLPCDVADAASVDAASARAERELGPIDVWVNNAMASVFAKVVETTPEEYRRVTEVTYLGYVHGTLAALRHMRPRNRGVVVQVGSALAYRSIPLQSAYCAAKHAVVGFTDSLRSELIRERSGVRVTAVHLPAINTPQFSWVRTRLPGEPQPVPPIFQPEVAARAIVAASDGRRREVLLAAPTMKAVWGQKFIPGWLDRHLSRMAWEGQQLPHPVDPGRRDNLFEPVPEDRGAHGSFDARAKTFSPLGIAQRHRGALLLGVAAVAGALLWARPLRGDR